MGRDQPAGFLTYGPYTPSVPTGERMAVWRLMIDVHDAPGTETIIRLDVYDVTPDQVLAQRDLSRHAWEASWTYQLFELPFVMDAWRAGHLMEFRTFFFPHAHVRADKIGYR